MSTFSDKQFKNSNSKGFFKNPFFYFLRHKFSSPNGDENNAGPVVPPEGEDEGRKHKFSNFAKNIKFPFAKLRKFFPFRKNLANIGGNFYFGLFPFILLGLLFSNFNGLAQSNHLKSKDIQLLNPFFKNNKNMDDNSLFFSQNKNLSLETPDLKIIQDNFIYGITTPFLLTTQTLGNIFGGSGQERKEITEYSIQNGDTIESIAQNFNISLNTLLWANNLSKNSTIKEGQNLVILPVSGVIHIVKSGDTVGEISKIYKAKIEDIVADNNLSNELDIFVGDPLTIRDGIMPPKPAPSVVQKQLVDSFFIYPAEGRITQGLHWYNAIDLANKCGSPIYAAAGGAVERIRYRDYGGGNQIAILHSDGIVTYYGHLMSIFVKPGDQVSVGDRIALMGETGKATGCHLHFGVIGAKNPLAKYLVGTVIKYK